MCFENQAQFHPLEFLKSISRDIEIYENTRVLSVHGHIITTDNGVVTADNIIFATHYPFSNVPGFYFIRQHQERSYVMALEGDEVPEKMSGMYYGIDKEDYPSDVKKAGSCLEEVPIEPEKEIRIVIMKDYLI